MSRKPEIDFEELKFAFEGFETMGEPINYFLDTKSGEILALCSDWEDFEELCLRMDDDKSYRYRGIEPLEPHDGFDIMENFARALPESAIKSRLLKALSQNKPFRRFKDALLSDLSVRNQWFAFHSDALAQHARGWLEAQGIEAEFKKPE